MSSPVIEFKNITVVKAKQKILDAISLQVKAGENVAILGPNGAGKSSLIKLITRQYYPLPEATTSFKIWGQETWDVFELRHWLGLVSPDLQYDYHREVTGMEVVLSGFFSSIGLFHEKVTVDMQRRALEIIEFLEISHLKDHLIDHMSSGEARRFLIGRALVHKPKALILDEPTSSLDWHTLYKFTAILQKIVNSGTSLILVTHQLSDIIPEISRVVLMKQGRINADGPKAQVLTEEALSKLFEAPIEIKIKDGYYYAMRG